MVSKFALGEIEALKADGLEPTPEDIIRLNALALIFERDKARFQLQATSFLPRCVLISENFYIREPALGHEIWLDALSRHLGLVDFDTVVSITAFALSRDVDSLPDPNEIGEIRKALKKFEREVRHFSRQQIEAAIEFVKHGFDECSYEFGARKRREKRGETARTGLFEIDECLALGVLNEGRVALWGITAAELKKMRRREVYALIRRAEDWHKFPADKNPGMNALGNFNSALDEIRERLEKERMAKNGDVA